MENMPIVPLPTGDDGYHFWNSPGGPTSFLAATGGMLALHFAGVKEFVTNGGASAGVFNAIANANNKSKLWVLDQVRHECYLSKISGLPNSTLDMINKLLTKDALKKGATTEALGQYIDTHFPNWGNLWILAIADGQQILMCAQGIWRIYQDGRIEKLSSTPPPVSVAVRATIAIPGIFAPVYWNGLYMYDGAYSWDDTFPRDLMKKFFNARDDRIVAFLVPSRRIEKAYLTLLLGRKFPHLFAAVSKPHESTFVVIPSKRVPSIGLAVDWNQRNAVIADCWRQTIGLLEERKRLTPRQRQRMAKFEKKYQLTPQMAQWRKVLEAGARSLATGWQCLPAGSFKYLPLTKIGRFW
jgi:predicted acylesterase/phospholipase RssA